MYLHLGNETIIDTENVIGIFDLDTSTVSKHTRDFLKMCETEDRVVNVNYDLPKSFILYNYDGEISVYISPISTGTLLKRMSNGKD